MARLAPYGKFRALDSNGDPLTGGKLYTYEAGTSTPKETYTTSDESVANANPVVLDAQGYADIWLASGTYKLVLTDENDVTQWTIDNVLGSGADSYLSTVVRQTGNITINQPLQNSLIICEDGLTISPESAVTLGDGFVFSVKNESDSDVTVDPYLSETVDGNATYTVSSGSVADFVSDGVNWVSYGAETVGLNSDNEFTGNNSFSGKFSYPYSGELTLEAGEITVTGVYHTVDTEGDSSSDSLDTINGGLDGSVLIIRQEDDARDVTITDAGNIVLPNDSDITLRDTKDVVELVYDNSLSKWVVVSSPASIEDASTTVSGVVEIATDAEVTAETATGGTGASLVATPANMKKHQGVAKAWVNFNGTGTVAIRDSYNVSSITDSGVGSYRVNFLNAMKNNTYSAFVSCNEDFPTTNAINTFEPIGKVFSPLTTSCSVSTQFHVANVAQSNRDCKYVALMILGD